MRTLPRGSLWDDHGAVYATVLRWMLRWVGLSRWVCQRQPLPCRPVQQRRGGVVHNLPTRHALLARAERECLCVRGVLQQ